MKLRLLRLFTTIIATMIALQTSADNFTAAQSGNWSAASTWSGGVVPPLSIGSNTISIPAGVIVSFDNDIYINDLFASLTVDGELEANSNADITQGLGIVSGTGTIRSDVYSILSFTSFNFDGLIDARTLTTSQQNLSITGSIDIEDSLNILGDSVTLASNGEFFLDSNSVIVCEGGVLHDNSQGFKPIGSYEVIYTGEQMITGNEIDSAHQISRVLVDLEDGLSVVYLMTDLDLQGKMEIMEGTFNIEFQDLKIRGGVETDPSSTTTGFYANQDSRLTIGGGESFTNTIQFRGGGSELQSLLIDQESAQAAELNSYLTVRDSLILLNGDFKVLGSNTLKVEGNGLYGFIWRNNGEILLEGNADFDEPQFATLKYTGSSKTSGVEMKGNRLNTLILELDDASQSLSLDRDLTVVSTTELHEGTMDLNGQTLGLLGDVENNTSFMVDVDQQSSLILDAEFMNQPNLKLQETNNYLEKFRVNLAGSSTDLMLNENLVLSDSLVLISGTVYTDHEIRIGLNGALRADSVESFIKLGNQGRLIQTLSANGSLSFPIGNADGRASIAMANNEDVSREFSVGLRNEVLLDGTTGYDLAQSAQVVNKTWDISTNSTESVDIDIQFEWTTNMEVNNFDRTNAFVSHYINGEWDAQSPTAAIASGAGTFVLAREGVTSLSPFSVQNEGATGLDDQAKPSVSLYPNPVVDQLKLDVADAEVNAVMIQDMTGKMLMKQSISSQADLNTIDMSAFNDGTYLVTLMQKDNPVFTEQIVKQ